MIAPSSIAALAILALPGAATVFAQGALTPPGAPAPMMKTLDQIEARTPIGTPGQVTTTTIVISSPGSYVLMGPVTVAAGNGIEITASDVTLDLNGFTIMSDASSGAPGGNGIYITAKWNISVKNGHIQGQTAYENDVFSGNGFLNGINATEANNIHIENVGVKNVSQHGINGLGCHVANCRVSLAGGYGIYAYEITRCIALTCGSSAITAITQASDSIGISYSSSSAITAEVATNCYAYSSNGPGIQAFETATSCSGASEFGAGISARIATNCKASSNASDGLVCSSAANCEGVASGAGYGIKADNTVQNSFGSSNSGTGLKAGSASNCKASTTTGPQALQADVAENCTASTTGGGYGINARTAANCIATSGSGMGLFATHSAATCYGFSNSGVGMQAGLANGCQAATASGPQALLCTSGAINCQGSTTGSGNAIQAGSFALNCHGESYNGTGIQTTNAENCYGYAGGAGMGISAYCATNCYGTSYAGTGLSTRNATNCHGASSSGAQGLQATGTANTCSGYRPGGTAINAAIAIGCTASSGTITATNKYDMP